MFRPITAYTLRLLLVLVVVISTAILIGLMQPPSAWVTLLHLNECELPCWIGIEPGKTTLAEAQRQIETVYGNNSAYELKEYGEDAFGVFGNQTPYSLAINLASANPPSIVRSVVLRPYLVRDELFVQPTLGELSNNFGNPQSVRLLIDGGGTVFFVLYREEGIVVATDYPTPCNKVSPNQQIGYIFLQGQSNRQREYAGFSTAPLAWQGFHRCYHF